MGQHIPPEDREIIDEPQSGEVIDQKWIEDGMVLAEVRTEDGVYMETYEFTEAEQIVSFDNTSVEHSFEVGDYVLDGREPTPSPEVNTVEIIELTGKRANEFETEDGKLVSEYKSNQFYPDNDPVVAGVYPNMSGDKVWHFPESRLHK